MATPKPTRSTGLLIAVAAVVAALVATGAAAFAYQVSLKDQELVVREVYGTWNGLLSDAKSLAVSAKIENRAVEKFRGTLGAFQAALTRYQPSAGGLSLDPLLDQKRRNFFSSLTFCFQFVKDIDGWLGTGNGVDALRAGWIRTRIGELDGLFGQDLNNLKDLLNNLINTSLRQSAERYGLVGSGLLAGLLALLVVLLFRLQGMNRELGNLNVHLNDMVLQRTSHLDQAMASLEKAQHQLVASEKLAVLGNLAAGVAHELNTPLAALQSGGELMSAFFTQGLGSSFRSLDALSPRAKAWLFQILELVFAQGELDYLPHDRVTLKALRTELTARGAPEPEVQAEAWSELGLTANRPFWDALCTEPEIVGVLTLARTFSDARRMAGVIVSAVGKASHVVQSLRHYLEGSRAEDETTFSLRKEWETVFALLGSQVKKGVAVLLEVPADLEIRGTRSRLSQVWINLVNNALQAMDRRGTLVVDAERAAGRVLVRVTDSGPGIPAEVQDKIFTPFFTTKNDSGGLGLGLDICRKIVERNRGTLSFESVPGRTVFTVDLPDPNP